MKIYVAGRTGEAKSVQLFQRTLEELGHEITHDWTGKEGGIKPDWSQDQELATEVATKDLNGVLNADAVILCGWGCEEKTGGGLGCFIEVGMALAHEKPVVVIGPCRESVFWYLPNVRRADDLKDGIKALEEMVS